MKVKASVILTKALELLENGAQTYVCAAIIDVETTMRWEADVNNIISKATQIWMTFKPKHIGDSNKSIQQWWPNGDPERIATLKLAIEVAKKRND